MSSATGKAGSGRAEGPPGLHRGDRATPALSLAVGRALGTVVVTVAGVLNVDSSEFPARVLGDLIEGQGNLAVAVDLGKALVDPGPVAVFAEAAQRASRRGAKFILERPPIEAPAVLHARGYTDLVEIRPRPEADA